MSKITLDLGHGGSDPGAVYGNLIEKNIVLVVGMACRDELLRHGIEVQMTRTSDVFVGLSERAVMANNWGANYFVSIHCNAGGGDRGEVIHSIYRGKGLELSNNISSEMSNIGQTFVKVYDKVGDGNKDYYAVIRETNMDAVIVECAFLDNETDNQIIDTIEEQKVFGMAIAKGILKQLGVGYKPTETIPVTPSVPSGELYRVRKSWSDASSQIGAYSSLENAKIACDKNPGYSVYDSNGNVVYTKAIENIDVIYQVYSNGRWLPNVKNIIDFAGIYGTPAQAIYANLSKGSIQYRVHNTGGNWLPWVTDRSDFAGVYGRNIDALEMKLVNLSGYNVKYRVYSGGTWLPWVINTTDYAGIYGRNIECLQVSIEKK